MLVKKGKALVTGGTGFIGSWLCRRLPEEGYEVLCLDDLSSGKKENLDGLRVEFLHHNVAQPLELKVDFIFHLASRASPADFSSYALDILLANSQGTYNMLKLAQQNQARFLLASSSEVYGNPQQHPQGESYWGHVNPVGLRSCYDESKRFAEALTTAFYRNKGLDVRIARIFNTYGERMRPDDGRVIPTFILQALQNQPLTIHGDGTQTRSFCYASDLVEGLMKLMFTDGLNGEVLNLGNPQEVNILELAQLIRKLTGSASEIAFRPLPQDDPVRRKPDITRARERLGWQPRVGLEEGLRRTIERFRSNLGGGLATHPPDPLPLTREGGDLN